VAGTLVLTPLGPVPIESILPGDEVVSVDAETGAPVVAKVLGVSRGIAAEPCTQVTVDAGRRRAEGLGAEDLGAEDRGAGGFGAQSLETFTATDGHPFLVLSGEGLDLRGDAEHVPLYEPLGTPRGRWVRAAELLPGDLVATRSGSATVVRVAPHARPEVVYNLHVEGTARYLVGACGVVVHNSPCSDAAEKAGASKIDRGAFRKEREAFWKAEAQGNPGGYSADDLERMKEGRPPIGSDGHPMELHHVDRTPDGGLMPMTRTSHRLGENYKRNHPSRRRP
jgi:hypothetical protein